MAAAAANTNTQPPTIAHQIKRCESGAGDGLSRVVVIAWLSPVWITLKRAVNGRDAGRVAAGLADHALKIPPDRVVVARGEVGVVGVQALHTTRRTADPSARTMGCAPGERCAPGKQSIPIARIAGMGRLKCFAEPRIGSDLGLSGANTALAFDARDSSMRERAGEPIVCGKRLPGVEDWRNLGDDRQAEIAPVQDLRRRAQRSPDLKGEHFAVALVFRHEGRMQSLTSVQKSDSPTTSTIITASAAARSARAPSARRRAQMSSAIASLVASSWRASAKS